MDRNSSFKLAIEQPELTIKRVSMRLYAGGRDRLFTLSLDALLYIQKAQKHEP